MMELQAGSLCLSQAGGSHLGTGDPLRQPSLDHPAGRKRTKGTRDGDDQLRFSANRYMQAEVLPEPTAPTITTPVYSAVSDITARTAARPRTERPDGKARRPRPKGPDRQAMRATEAACPQPPPPTLGCSQTLRNVRPNRVFQVTSHDREVLPEPFNLTWLQLERIAGLLDREASLLVRAAEM